MNKISFSINYVTNFKPSKNFSENHTFFKNKNNIILCKHFIIFFYLLKYILKNNTNIKIFFKPKKSKIETLLRPPYRHKISRHQITLSRYYLVVSFYTNLSSNELLLNPTQVLFFLNEILKNFSFFETNICYTHCVRVKMFFYYNEFFQLMNHKK